jgi:ligand-binding sensor domain-containing protein
LKTRSIFFIVFFLLSVSALCVKAQDLENMQFDLLDEEDGLSNHGITQMTFDQSGYLWIATVDGLNRYDGYSFKICRHEDDDSTSVKSNFITGLQLDKNGRLWVSYGKGGLSAFEESCQCFNHYGKNDTTKFSVDKTAMGRMFFDSENTLWFCGKALGLNKYDAVTGKVKNFHLPDIDNRYPEPDLSNYNGVNDIYERDGLFWLATANGLYSFDKKTESFKYFQYAPIDINKARADYFLQILPENDKGFWLPSWGGGISWFDLKSEKFTTYRYISTDLNTAIGNIVSHIAVKDENTLWVLTSEKGLGTFDKRTGKYTFREDATQTNTFPTRFTAFPLFTPEGIMFLSSETGLMKYNPYAKLFNYKVLPIHMTQNNDKYVITDIVDTDDKMYFAVTFGDGFNVLDKKTGKLTAYNVDVPKGSRSKYSFGRALHLDQHNQLWFLSRDFIYRFDQQNNKLQKISDPYQPSHFDHTPSYAEITEDKDGDVWIGTYKKGVLKYSYKDNQFRSFENIVIQSGPDTLKGVSYLDVDKFNRLWFVTADDRVVTFDKEKNSFNLLLQNTPVKGHIIDGLKMDKSGNPWLIIRGKGLAKITLVSKDSVQYELVNSKAGLPSENITGIECDSHNNIWLTSYSGIIMFNANEKKFRMFNQSSGLDINFINSKLLNVNADDFYIASWGRYCKVNYQLINKELPIPKVYVDKFKIYDKDIRTELSDKKTITLRPSDDFFSFDFGCIDYVNSSHNKFAYMLEGWDKDWVYCSNRRYASYTNLNGGNYTFKVKAVNDAGAWSEQASVPLIIQTPLYKKSWFIALLASLFYGIIYALYRYRIREIEKTERLKTQFNQELSETRMQALRAQMNPHFIFNCLNSINRYIIKSDIKTASLYLTKFAKLIRLILDNSENKKVLLSNELEALKLYIEMEALRFDNKFSYQLKVDENVGADSIEVPPLIIQPYVENAIWHGLLHKEESGHLQINVSRMNGNIVCEIEDNGVGREKAKFFKSKTAVTRKSVGMKLTEERLKILNASMDSFSTVHIVDLRDESGNASGTKVVLQIPV